MILRCSNLVLCEAALRLGTIHEAARRLGQPTATVSLALMRLEAEAGLSLARRNTDGLALTMEGQRALPHLSRMVGRLRDASGTTAGTLPFGSFDFATLMRVAEALRLGTIRSAARSLGIGQPQLSRQLARVEATIGRPLALRGDTGLVCLPEGQAFEATVGLIAADWAEIAGPTRGPMRRDGRPVSLGAVVPASPHGELAELLATLTRHLHETHRLAFTLTSTLADDLLAGLDNGRFDCVFLDARLRDRFYGQIELSRSPVALCGLPAGFRARDDEASRPARLEAVLAGRPLVLQSRRSGLRQRAEAFLDSCLPVGWRSRADILEIDALPIIVNMVGAGGYLSVLPLKVAETMPVGDLLPLPDRFDQHLMLTFRPTARSRRVIDMVTRALGLVPAP